MSLDDILKGAKYLRDNGIKMMTQNILGAPGETKEQMLKTLELNIAVKPAFASASIFQPYPGTAIGEYCKPPFTINANPTAKPTVLTITSGKPASSLRSPITFMQSHYNFLYNICQ